MGGTREAGSLRTVFSIWPVDVSDVFQSDAGRSQRQVSMDWPKIGPSQGS